MEQPLSPIVDRSAASCLGSRFLMCVRTTLRLSDHLHQHTCEESPLICLDVIHSPSCIDFPCNVHVSCMSGVCPQVRLHWYIPYSLGCNVQILGYRAV